MITFVDIEEDPESCVGFASRDKREQLQVSMIARLLATDGELRQRIWVKINDVERRPGSVLYHGVVTTDSYLDLDPGTPITFGPEHVCEWDLDPSFRPGRRR